MRSQISDSLSDFLENDIKERKPVRGHKQLPDTLIYFQFNKHATRIHLPTDIHTRTSQVRHTTRDVGVQTAPVGYINKIEKLKSVR